MSLLCVHDFFEEEKTEIHGNEHATTLSCTVSISIIFNVGKRKWIALLNVESVAKRGGTPPILFLMRAPKVPSENRFVVSILNNRLTMPKLLATCGDWPVGHCELNPIELVSTRFKSHIAESNTCKIEDLVRRFRSCQAQLLVMVFSSCYWCRRWFSEGRMLVMEGGGISHHGHFRLLYIPSLSQMSHRCLTF